MKMITKRSSIKIQFNKLFALTSVVVGLSSSMAHARDFYESNGKMKLYYSSLSQGESRLERERFKVQFTLDGLCQLQIDGKSIGCAYDPQSPEHPSYSRRAYKVGVVRLNAEQTIELLVTLDSRAQAVDVGGGIAFYVSERRRHSQRIQIHTQRADESFHLHISNKSMDTY